MKNYASIAEFKNPQIMLNDQFLCHDVFLGYLFTCVLFFMPI